ncbi:MAG TPA: hypothetical protein VJU87_12690 [Gemmatimonadaceae bacterium]|nr:hypothetical protein [Gemmatimonadaceae bacterium]
MSTAILYHRLLPHGPEVRIRRTSHEGERPVVAVLEVDRRAGTARSARGFPPPLMRCEAASEQEAIGTLEPHARDDRRVVQLMRQRGQR